MEHDLLYLLGFSAFSGIGPYRVQLLRNVFHSLQDAWYAKSETLEQVLPKSIALAFVRFRKEFDMHGYYQELQRQHIGVVPMGSSRYPVLLAEISDPPLVLYVKGKKASSPIDMKKTIAVVGSRQTTRYGEEVARTLVCGLVQRGWTIISGMAYGIDAVVHEAAIRSKGKTIAVLGCGVDICAPKRNLHIYRKLSEGGYGAVISEMPLGHRPTKGLFVTRNRIISGLSQGVVVIEGGADSGTLITARYAAEQGREVFIVPGPITSETSRGPLKLLRDGAIPITSVDDIEMSLGLAK